MRTLLSEGKAPFLHQIRDKPGSEGHTLQHLASLWNCGSGEENGGCQGLGDVGVGVVKRYKVSVTRNQSVLEISHTTSGL